MSITEIRSGILFTGDFGEKEVAFSSVQLCTIGITKTVSLAS